MPGALTTATTISCCPPLMRLAAAGLPSQPVCMTGLRGFTNNKSKSDKHGESPVCFAQANSFFCILGNLDLSTQGNLWQTILCGQSCCYAVPCCRVYRNMLCQGCIGHHWAYITLFCGSHTTLLNRSYLSGMRFTSKYSYLDPPLLVALFKLYIYYSLLALGSI